MPSLKDMLAKPLPPLETPQQRDARMAAFRKRFPALVAAAERHGVPGYRSEVETYQEGIFDDD